MVSTYDVIVLGGASAGLTASLYAGRQGLRALTITKDIGGQAVLTDSIENYPGFDHIGGFELMSKFEKQAKAYGTEFAYEEAVELVENEPTCFTVRTTTNSYQGCALILTFGKTPRDLQVPGEQELKGKGVSYCAICDGPLFRQKRVAVVGAGDAALDAAILLKSLASKVYVIHRTERTIGSEQSVKVLQSDANVQFVDSSIVTRINGSSKVESITIQNTSSKSQSNLEIDGVFVEMGYVAKTDFVKDLVQLNGSKEIVVDSECKTSHPGIFAAGDVTNVPYKQAVISAGQGAIAALSAYNYIQRLRGRPTVKNDWKAIPTKT